MRPEAVAHSGDVRARLQGDICAPLGLQPSAAQVEALLDFLAQLQRWNRTYNLTAVRDPEGMLVQHLADCLAVLPQLDRLLPTGELERELQVLDVGSGGGLPGVVLAIMRPAWTVSCIDTVGKKAAFVQQVSGMLRLQNLVSLHGRVEQLQPPMVNGRLGYGLITSRAFASLPDFCHLTRHLLSDDGRWLALKGKLPEEELRDLQLRQPAVEVFHVEPLQVPGLDAQRCVIWMGARTKVA